VLAAVVAVHQMLPRLAGWLLCYCDYYDSRFGGDVEHTRWNGYVCMQPSPGAQLANASIKRGMCRTADA
jgi:hypothetical protein